MTAVVDFTTLLCSLRCIVFNCLWLNYLTLCKGLGLEVQSLALGLDQKGWVLGNFWSLGLGLEEKVLFTYLDIMVKSCAAFNFIEIHDGITNDG